MSNAGRAGGVSERIDCDMVHSGKLLYFGRNTALSPNKENTIHKRVDISRQHLKEGDNLILTVGGNKIYANSKRGKIGSFSAIGSNNQPLVSAKSKGATIKCKICVDVYVDGKYTGSHCWYIDCSDIKRSSFR